jgi:hypothetical protein
LTWIGAACRLAGWLSRRTVQLRVCPGQFRGLRGRSLNTRIEDFTAWANREAARHGIPGQAIPADPCGPVGMARLRRTLAWHVARRPGGLIALAIQYGHMRTVLDARTSSG